MKFLKFLAVCIWLGVLAFILVGCGSTQVRPTPVVEVKAPVKVNKVLIVPDKILEECKPLPNLAGGERGTVLKWAIEAHGEHGLCMYKKDLSDNFLRAAADTGAKVELYQPK